MDGRNADIQCIPDSGGTTAGPGLDRGRTAVPLNVCLGTANTSGRPAARLFFFSSISAGAGMPIPGTVAERYIEYPAHAQPSYARSKVVTEHIVKAAAEQTSMTARVLRLGQIIGDTERGIWNTTEAIPLLFRRALTTSALPAVDETPSWMPVDKMVAWWMTQWSATSEL